MMHPTLIPRPHVSYESGSNSTDRRELTKLWYEITTKKLPELLGKDKLIELQEAEFKKEDEIPAGQKLRDFLTLQFKEKR